MPGRHWEVGFTEVIKEKYGYRYLLTFTDTFSGWIEVFPMKHGITKQWQKPSEIIPRYEAPETIG